ncbi:MAG: hypothetical protein F6K50_07895 [Moorea sp. SIO3I7]|nr:MULTISPECIES: hypothetical protein [unclassified Moorena]NEN95449.1 hypothetical protein [Moorena sp. SIO3I7]NEO07298.1 hypothetical protein [Moorena sp. SIO3I8]NEO22279.1 hypothetical protein [Moorena sp. SIO4A5]NEP25540.1 hypothetical protein [Moorena sp. SIO3I6]
MACEAIIPPKSNRRVQRKYDKQLYKAQHLFKNLFPKIKQYRAMATGTIKLLEMS